MANEKHIALLGQGIDAWNAWRKKHPRIRPDLSGADLSGFYLSRADLSNADLSGADLKKVDFDATTLMRSLVFEKFEKDGHISTNFHNANLSRADLRKTNLRLANLSNANLTEANLTDAILLMANFSSANLGGVNLTRTQALTANFSKAILTGACIQEWNINGETDLDGVVCEYVYLHYIQRERLSIDRHFAPGEFTKLFEKTTSIIELIFNNGVDWISFAYTFGKLKIENGDAELVVQSIDNKGDGVVVIKVKVSPNTDKMMIYQDFMEGYNLAHKTLGEQYQARLEDKDKNINQLITLFQEAQEKLGEVPKFMADNPRIININDGNYIESNTGTYVQGDYINMSQDLTQAAAQIQDLIEQLQERGVTVDVAQDQVAQDIATKAQSNPKIKDKLLKWGQSLGDATVSDVVKSVVKLAIRSAGIPLP